MITLFSELSMVSFSSEVKSLVGHDFSVSWTKCNNSGTKLISSSSLLFLVVVETFDDKTFDFIISHEEIYHCGLTNWTLI